MHSSQGKQNCSTHCEGRQRQRRFLPKSSLHANGMAAAGHREAALIDVDPAGGVASAHLLAMAVVAVVVLLVAPAAATTSPQRPLLQLRIP
jgi:hypothetical protein